MHGHAAVKGATILPHNIGLGATRDPELVQRIGRATTEEIALHLAPQRGAVAIRFRESVQ